MLCKYCSKEIKETQEVKKYTENNLTHNYHAKCLETKIAKEKESSRVKQYTKDINKVIVSVVNRGYINLTIINSYITIWTGNSTKNDMLSRGHIVEGYPISFIYEVVKNNILLAERRFKKDSTRKLSKDEHTRRIMIIYENILMELYNNTVPQRIIDSTRNIRIDISRDKLKMEAKNNKLSIEHKYYKEKKQVMLYIFREKEFDEITYNKYRSFSVAYNKYFNKKYSTEVPLEDSYTSDREIEFIRNMHIIKHVERNSKLVAEHVNFY